MRYLGIDYGTKRIGLAISDPSGSIASPLTTVPARGTLSEQARAVRQAAVAYDDIGACVVGLPLNEDGSEGPQAKLTRQFAAALEHVMPGPLHLWNEHLSSVTADELLAAGDFTRKERKARHDRLAAQIILQGFLDAGPKERSAHPGL
ncbi:MAG TPA: Holliday junction resolvase RuvX [Phycisphaerae bacterium]|jgi:putative Holliday junction resolvase